MGGGLYDPLGTDRPAPTHPRVSVAVAAAGLLLAAVLGFGLMILMRGGGERGEPRSIVTIEHPPSPPVQTAVAPPPPAPAASGHADTAAAPSPLAPPDADVEIQNGVRIIRMRPGSADAAGRAPSFPPGPPTPPEAARAVPSR